MNDSISDDVKHFFEVIKEDLAIHRPQTSLLEINNLLTIGLSILNNKKEISKTQETALSFLSLDELKTFINANTPLKKKGFLWRPLYSGAPIHHEIPSDYDIFTEVSGDIYENYMCTLNALSGKHLDKTELAKQRCLALPNELEMCHDFLCNHDYLLVWSNTVIVVDNVLSENEFKDKTIVVYGGPLMVAQKENLFIINVYHEQDWILGLVKLIYNIDLHKELKRNTVYELFINQDSYKIVILSDAFFKDKNILPHRQYNHFLL